MAPVLPCYRATCLSNHCKINNATASQLYSITLSTPHTPDVLFKLTAPPPPEKPPDQDPYKGGIHAVLESKKGTADPQELAELLATCPVHLTGQIDDNGYHVVEYRPRRIEFSLNYARGYGIQVSPVLMCRVCWKP